MDAVATSMPEYMSHMSNALTLASSWTDQTVLNAAAPVATSMATPRRDTSSVPVAASVLTRR